MKYAALLGFLLVGFAAQAQTYPQQNFVPPVYNPPPVFNPNQYMLSAGNPAAPTQVHQCTLVPNGNGGFIQRCF